MRACLALGLSALVAMSTVGSAQVVVDCYDGDELGSGGRFAASQMTVRRDGRCSHGGVLFDVTLDTPPRNGRVELSGSGVTYIPNPGFVGSDSYVFSGDVPAGARGVGSRALPTGRVSVTVSVTVE